VALPAGVLPALGSRLAAVAALALERGLGRSHARIATLIRTRKGRSAKPSMVMIDGQTVRGGRAGPTSTRRAGEADGRTVPSTASWDGTLSDPGSVKAIVADRGYRGLAKMAAKRQITLDIKAPPKGTVGFTPIAPLYRVEHAF
jgi:putative transposase